jgi:hypothetical protein
MGDDEDYAVPDEWYDTEITLFDNLISNDADVGSDLYLQDLFDTAMFDPDASQQERETAYSDLVDYLWDQYDIDFDYAFDWEDYREWYDTAA